MNERIQEIAEQNGFIHEFQSPVEQRDILKNLKKFAELIVRECTELVEYNSKGAAQDIREHFGVEE